MARIKVTDNRHGNSFRTGINGRIYDIPLNQEFEVEDGLVDHLKGLGVAFEEVSSKGASSSKEGSGEVLAPTSALAAGGVRAPAMDAKSVGQRPLMGDQPGDPVEAGGDGPGATKKVATLERETALADARVEEELHEKEIAVPMKIVGTDSPPPASADMSTGGKKKSNSKKK